MAAGAQSVVLRDLQKAHGKLLDVSRYILPRDDLAIAYTTADAVDKKGVAIARGSSVGFGVDEPIVKTLLTVRRFDPTIRSAACIRYEDDILATAVETLRDVEVYDPEKFPVGISTMDWGIASVCRKGVPLAIANPESSRGPGRICLLGTTPEEVANRILIISQRLTYIDI
ncbi:MAG: Bifunctional thiamine biosynthesis protein ThiDN [Methanocorpusculum sp. MCE]|nr:MAG: Bifunctional thiamine biosynthesis protein ThiDN [Methanocorpusculum sp. MCE]